MKKRIVIVAEYFPPRLGADRRIFELMKRLSRRYDIHFITLPPSYTLFIRKLESNQGSGGQSKDNDVIVHDGIRGHSLTLPSALLSLWAKGFLFPFLVTWSYLGFQIMRKIAQLKPEIIIINNTSVYTGFLGFICSKILRKKLLVEYNDLEALYAIDLVGNRTSKFLLPTLRRLLVSIEDIIVKNGWRVTAITAFISSYALARNTRNDIVVIPDGVDTDLFDAARFTGRDIRFKHGVHSDDTLCVYAGRIEHCAGIGIILETAKFLKSDKGIKFMIVGEGDKALADQLLETKNMILTGSVPKEDVPEYLAAANIVLVPFPESIASHSISPLKLFEALAMNKPVIASAVSGIKEVVSEDFNGLLAPASPEHWAHAILELARRREMPIQNQKNNREIVSRRYSWNTLAEDFAKVLENGN